MEENDVVVVARARDGDNDAFRTLVDRHSRRIFRLAWRMTGSEQDAEDLVQETFLRAYRNLASFQERADFGTWLYRIAVNCSLDWRRERRPHEELNENLEPDHEWGVPMSKSPGGNPARADSSAHVRGQALFWLAQKAGKKAGEAITAAIDNDPETEVKKKAVFALSQLPKDEGIPQC